MAVRPPAELVEAVRRLERPARPGLRWTPEDQWHVTLSFFADVDAGALLDALGRAAWPENVVAEAGPGPEALSRRVWVLPVAGLEALAGAVAAATDALAPPEARPFHGHLTLARAREPGALRGLPGPPVAVRWQVAEVLAFRSDLRREGAVHHVIGRWPLTPG